MMTKNEYIETINRQDKYAEEIETLQNKIDELEFEMANLLHKLPSEELFAKYFQNTDIKSNNPMEICKSVFTFHMEHPEKFKEISQELDTYPEYKKLGKKQKEYDTLKYQYFAKIYAFHKMIEKDRKTFFSKTYNKIMDSLAERGIFLYYQQTPDAPIEGLSIDDAEKLILNDLSSNNFYMLCHMLSQILTTNSLNPLQENKRLDLQEALNCIINGIYQSCARTMFSLLENEHTNASNLIKQSTGFERSNEINKYVEEMGSDYYKKVWRKLNKYYKKLNCNTEKMDKETINRNDLAHGTYKHIATKEDCIKLILLYLSFKELSFYLQRMIGFKNELMKDTINFILQEIEKLEKDQKQ